MFGGFRGGWRACLTVCLCVTDCGVMLIVLLLVFSLSRVLVGFCWCSCITVVVTCRWCLLTLLGFGSFAVVCCFGGWLVGWLGVCLGLFFVLVWLFRLVLGLYWFCLVVNSTIRGVFVCRFA